MNANAIIIILVGDVKKKAESRHKKCINFITSPHFSIIYLYGVGDFIVPQGTQGIKKWDDIFFIVIFSNKLNGECAAYKSNVEV